MSFLKLYTRVLRLLGPEAKLGWVLAFANLALAIAQFAEPVLFGRIIDALVKTQAANTQPDVQALTPLLAAWVGFGLFTIACSVLVALHADRLSHRRKQAVMTMYFEHVLQLPLAFHGGTHSGRLMKVMLTGVDALWSLWLSFFREHFAAVRLAVRAAAVVAVHELAAGLAPADRAVRRVHRPDRAGDPHAPRRCKRTVEGHYTALAERTSDALGNIALVQGFRAHRGRGREPARRRSTSCWPRRCRCCPGGR